MASKNFPSGKIPSEGHDLLARFAFSHRISITEALRMICIESQLLKEFAGESDLSEYFGISNTWGGKRPRKE